LREKDVIVALKGQPLHMNTKQFNVHLKLNYKVGDDVPITVLRDGKRIDLKIHLVE
jgi:S1-C subfamily serine protease